MGSFGMQYPSAGAERGGLTGAQSGCDTPARITANGNDDQMPIYEAHTLGYLRALIQYATRGSKAR